MSSVQRVKGINDFLAVGKYTRIKVTKGRKEYLMVQLGKAVSKGMALKIAKLALFHRGVTTWRKRYFKDGAPPAAVPGVGGKPMDQVGHVRKDGELTSPMV